MAVLLLRLPLVRCGLFWSGTRFAFGTATAGTSAGFEGGVGIIELARTILFVDRSRRVVPLSRRSCHWSEVALTVAALVGGFRSRSSDAGGARHLRLLLRHL